MQVWAVLIGQGAMGSHHSNSPEEIEVATRVDLLNPYEVAKAIPEVVHRYFAATLGFFIVCIYALTFRYKEVSANIKKPFFILIGLGNFTRSFWLLNRKP